MNTLPTSVRWIVATSLVLSLSVTDLYSRWIAQGEGNTGTATKQRRSSCCCGTMDGRCCGKACCQTPKPPDDGKAPLLPGREDRWQPLALCGLAEGTIANKAVRAHRLGMMANAGGYSIHSLTELNVRLDC